jgi:type IV pilus assembly protein PilN
MIRINLLPQKRALRGRGGAEDGGGSEGQVWLAFVVGAVVLQIIILLFVYKTKQDQLSQVVKSNSELSANVDNIKRDISQHATIKTQLKELRDREEAIQKLQSARSGPTAAMLELSRIVTPGRGPTVDRDKLEQLKRDSPSSVPNAGWDPRRLWLSSYKESDRSVRLGGSARDAEDVSEFLRRLTLSDFFYDVKLLPATKSVDSVTKIELVRFEMSAKARY